MADQVPQLVFLRGEMGVNQMSSKLVGSIDLAIGSKRAFIHVLRRSTRSTIGLRFQFQIEQFHGFASGELFMKLFDVQSSQI